MCRRWVPIVLLFAALQLVPGPVRASTRLLRFPDIHGDRIAFCYAGDLWLAPADGGSARRLTAHPGQELFPKFSPDGHWIAFTGQYDGDEQVYVVPTEGGVPRRLTHYPARGPLPPRWGYDNQVYDWTPDGNAVLFRSMRDSWSLSGTRLYTVPLEGGLPESLPMPVSGAGDIAPDGRRVVYSPLVRDFRTWKRYEGGWAQDLFIFDPETRETRPVTRHKRSDRDPMWIGNKIYFSSDRSGTLNLFAFDIGVGRTEQLTRSQTWDVRWPSDDGRSRIVYELNGELQVLDLATGVARSVPIFVPDDGVSKRPSRIAVADDIEDFELSPKGKRALFVARGDVFTVPAEHGPVRNLTRSSDAHDRWARWSPDGSRIAFVSDKSGEDAIWVVAQDGSTPPVQLSDGRAPMLYAPAWSPDSKRLAFGDKDGKLHVLELDRRKQRTIADEARGQIRHYAWSPGGGYLAFTLSDPSGFGSIQIWSVADGRTRAVTDGMFDEFAPVWDPAGDYLYYLGDREFAPQLTGFEWNFAVNRSTGIYALALRDDVDHPFPPRSDEVDPADAKKQEDDDDDKEVAGSMKKIRIDFDGLAGRVARVPVPFDNYDGLWAVKGKLLYTREGAPFYGRESARPAELMVFSLEDREAETLAAEIAGYAIAHDGSKVLIRRPTGYTICKPAPGDDSCTELSTEGLTLDRIPAEEWGAIFDEVWRRFRDFFYVENMHGYDWEALRARYRPLLEHVAHRSDLNYVIGEMIAELNVGHAYISGGDFEIPERAGFALPGARFEAHAGRYRIAKIFRGHNEEDRYRSPLTEINVDAREGDYVLAIDGVELLASDNPYRLLRHKGSRPVTLTVNRLPEMKGARSVTFVPVGDEADLLYLEMVESNRERVDRLSGGRIGYLHLPDMGADGIREFIKWFYPQIRKEGLIVDVRNNGGGNVSQMVIERLRRTLLGTRFSRTSDTPGTYPSVVFHGQMACILDENSASDGDIFPHMFRQAGLGPLIGKRSWGGVVGITNRGTLLDGGTVYVPEFGTNAPDGAWAIEGYGVEPDIEVDNDPASVLAGRDPQLERAVADVLTRMKTNPLSLPERPEPPVKTP